MRTYQLVYAVNTVTYEEKLYKILIFKVKIEGWRGAVGDTQYVYIHKHTEVIFKRGDIMSHIHRKTLDTPLFPGITA